MAFGKWIGGFLGFIAAGPLGALAGIVLGSLFEKGLDDVNTPDNNVFGNSRQEAEGQRNSFFFSLLVLAAYVIKADGKVMHSEMECVRQFLRNNFGIEAEQQGNKILLSLFEEQAKMDARQPGAFRNAVIQSGEQIAANMDYGQRLQLLNFLAMIAKADGRVTTEEMDAIRQIAAAMRLSAKEVDSMFNLGNNDLDSAYKVLEIPSSATDDEVKAAYRRMALKHHPDRVAALGEDVRLAAEKKFQEINEAKERIYKARGIR